MKSVHYLLLGLMLIVVMLLPRTKAAADIIDNFDSYSTGSLSSVSGGEWNTWLGSPTDAWVTNQGQGSSNTMRQEGIDTPDVVTYSPVNILGRSGARATASFDFLIHEEGSLNDPVGWFLLGAGNAVDSSIDYSAGSVALGIDSEFTDVGTTNLATWDAFAETYLHPELSGRPLADVWQHVDIELTQTVVDLMGNDPLEADGSYNVLLNSSLLAHDLPFRLNSASGLNALEIWYEADATDNYILYDNISITSQAAPVPEPTSLALLGVGLLGFVFERKRNI